ncbi:restriction endonuclease subunit S [Megamonas hypermegale]|uniref:restriction endonuclease subunit S n=1 Tax=Megamonas hypermegale TaxID=158847 RepID=UPI003207B9B7
MDKYKKILSGYKALGFNEEMLMDDILIVFMIRQKIRNQRKSVDYLYDNEKMRFLWSETVDELSQKISSLNRSNKSIRDRFIMVNSMDFSLTGLIDIIHNYKMVMSVSPALENIIIEEINSGKAKSVLILGAEGFSGNLLKAVQAHKDIKFSFMTNISADSSCIFLLNEIYKEVYREEFYKSYKDEEVAINDEFFKFMLEECDNHVYFNMNVNFITESIYSYRYYENKYDLIVAVPKFGTISDTFLRSQMIASSWDLMATEILLKSLNEKGVLKVILTPKIIFSGGKDSKFRKYLLDNYKLLEIADLPAGLFNNVTMVKTVLLTLSTGTSDKIQVKKYVSDKPLARNTECTSLNIDKEETISIEELQADDSWNISLLLESDDEVTQYKNTGLPMVKLEDIADVFRGKAISKLDSGKKVGVINIADITDNEIDYDKVSFVNDEQQKIIKYLLEDGDILISSRGTTIKVAMFEKQDEQYIPAVNFNVIRIHESAKSKIKSEYLKIFFASSIGQKLLASLQRGGVVMNINAKDLYSLNIPLLSLQEQQKIIDQYNEEFAKYKRTLKQITDKWNNVKENIDHIFITKRE